MDESSGFLACGRMGIQLQRGIYREMGILEALAKLHDRCDRCGLAGEAPTRFESMGETETRGRNS